MTFFLEILQDAFFGGVAGIGFASISNPPKNAYKYCFIISAVGHGTRFILMNLFNHYLYLCTSNGFTCAFDILGMVLGATLPILILNNISYKVTRYTN